VGRKGQDFALTHGWVPRDVDESVSWGLEGYINDAGLARMAQALADAPGTPDGRRRSLRDEAAYLRQSSLGYVHLFDAATGFFRGRGRDGSFGSGPFDPDEWGGDYTESDAWNFLFHPVHDGAGLAALHGGREGLERLLERFFATPERADKPGTYGSVIHEMVEARDVRLGQLGQSNQVSHHIPYAWLLAGRPDRTQEAVREILARLWTGNEIGQGYHGDEDNGEMSAWYILSALGLYPLEIGSSRWAVGSPLFERAVVHRPDGDLVVEAPGASGTVMVPVAQARAARARSATAWSGRSRRRRWSTAIWSGERPCGSRCPRHRHTGAGRRRASMPGLGLRQCPPGRGGGPTALGAAPTVLGAAPTGPHRG
jgi:predicted alpha-1,2-mannosidase